MEKELVLHALGATIVRTKTELAHDHPESMMGTAQRLNKEIPNSHILDQYVNSANPDAHYYDTAGEILIDFGTDLDVVVIGAGTGGTITGIAKRLKEEIPNIKIVGVDPYGSILAGGDEVFEYYVEGIGYDFFPEVFKPSIVDEWVKTNDKDSFLMARRLIKEESLLVGGSSGSAVWAALQVTSRLKKGQKCLVILPDSIRNYLSKFVSDEWMIEKGFME
jgi:cystathionine beta-synthase/cysteine synthase A